MKILLDAMYDGLKEYLEEIGWQVKTVKDLGKSNAKDPEVRSYAKENGYVLVTQDKRSADVARRSGIECVLVSLGDIADLVKERIIKGYIAV
jgi:predicted nuclease of predicted toxin-antitoxin system